MNKNQKVILILACLFLGLGLIAQFSEKINIPVDGLIGGQVSDNTISNEVTIIASTSITTIATTPIRLVEDPGSNCALELVSITAFRVFSSESWAHGANQAVDDGFEVRLDETSIGTDVIASFSKGFTTGGATATTASPSFQTRMGLDVNASVSESLWLTASSAYDTLDGDTYFRFDTSFRKICTQ